MSETLKSAFITNRDASPSVLSNPILAGAFLHEAIGSVVTGAAAAVGSKYIMCQVPSNARVSSVILQTAAQGTSCAADVGVYKNTVDGGAVISQAFFASAVDVSSALTSTEVLNESGTNTIAKQEQPLWQALGLAADPFTTFDVVATLTAVTVAGGALSLKVRYAQ